MPLLIFVLLLLGILLYLIARRGRERAGLPEGEVLYSDTWLRVEKPLFSKRLGLTGRPDYLVRHGGGLLPVEVKSAQAPPGGPYDSHVYQLAAYCLLVEEQYGERPGQGIIKYADRSFTVDFTPRLEQETLDLLEAMRADAEAEDVHRSHESPSRCARCGYREVCDETLSTI